MDRGLKASSPSVLPICGQKCVLLPIPHTQRPSRTPFLSVRACSEMDVYKQTHCLVGAMQTAGAGSWKRPLWELQFAPPLVS